jgi:Ca2+-binding EF-hand superfamily protein
LDELFKRIDNKNQNVIALINFLKELLILLPEESEKDLVEFLMEIDIKNNGYINL